MRRTFLSIVAAIAIAVLAAISCTDNASAPRYEWRGAMLDLSRHFFPVEHIHRQIDALHCAGINVLHLHLTDAAGWRFETKAYPQLTDIAAWRTAEGWKEWWNGDRGYADSQSGYGGYYTQEELREIVQHADRLGIMVLPEIEMPGHSEEIFAAYPDLLCEGGQVSGQGVEHGHAQADFCAGNERTFELIFGVLDEVMDVFPSPYIHIGGDEAGRQMWETCSRCQARMQEHGFQTTAQLQAWFMRRVCNYLEEHGRRAVCWDEVLEGWQEMDSIMGSKGDNAVSGQKPVIMCWRGQAKGAEAVSKGFDVVMCPGEYCYFDNAQDAPCTQPEANGGYLPFDKVFSYNPAEGIAEGDGRLIGLQANLWAEYIPTPAHAEYMLYPRILGIAQIGLGNAALTPAEAHSRAVAFADSLRAAGYNAFDLRNEAGQRPEMSDTLVHIARGCKVTYNNMYSQQYAAAGDESLVDGLRGGWANNDGRWQGFIGDAGMDVTLDLGSEQPVTALDCDFQQICQPWIFQPTTFIVSTSTDGTAFSEAYRHDVAVTDTPIPTVEHRSWHPSAPVTTRYIRVQALPHKAGAWIFCDEIVIR